MNAWLVGALVIGAAILYSLIGVVLVRHLMRGRVLEGHNDVLSPVFATAGVIYAVLVGFVVIAVWETYGSAKDNVQNEATALTSIASRPACAIRTSAFICAKPFANTRKL